MRFRILLLLLLIYNIVYGQLSNFLSNSDTLNKKRYKTVLISETIATIGSIALLNEVWYKNYPQSRLHFFDDNKEWLQMDKFGHATASYYLGLTGIELMKWSGVKGVKRSIIGGSLGFVYLTGVELLDGKSSKWGFSISDFLANAMGSAFVITQDLLWKEQRFRLKMSAHLTDYAKYRPNLLGSSILERLLKDYNGQTIWLSANIKSFLHKKSKFPKWLSLAIGIGAENMISGEDNTPVFYKGIDISNNYKRYRKYFLSIDVDLSKVNSEKKYIKVLTSLFGVIKIPFPALELSKGKFTFNPFYF